MNELVFGPLNSRRFGLSLGVDLSPHKKQCNYDCIYCELSPSTPVMKNTDYPSVDEVIKDIKENTQKYDVLTITANGEPSLYPHLGLLIDRIHELNLGKKVLILSNGTGVINNYEALLRFDMVKLSIDSVCEKTYRRIDRAHEKVDLPALLEKIIAFSKEYKGELILETLVIAGVNDSDEDIKALNEVYAKINALRLDLSTLDRPPAYPCKAISDERLHEIAHQITSIPVFIAKRKDSRVIFSFSKEELLKLIALRPASFFDASSYTKETQKYLHELLDEGKLSVKKLGGIEFYKAVK